MVLGIEMLLADFYFISTAIKSERVCPVVSVQNEGKSFFSNTASITGSSAYETASAPIKDSELLHDGIEGTYSFLLTVHYPKGTLNLGTQLVWIDTIVG